MTLIQRNAVRPINRDWCSRVVLRAALSMAFSTLIAAPSHAQPLNEHCVVSILNRTAQVRPDGSWQLPNVPANFGPVRARATCVENGVTRSGESELFTIVAGRMNAIPPIILGPTTPIPGLLTLTSGLSTLTQGGQITQLTATATYASGNTQDVTAAAAGTTYATTNAGIASVGSGGLVTAVRSGTVIIRATNEGTAGLLAIRVQLTGDSDGDGIPDDVEIAAGLNPNNPVDALEDADHDGLSNRAEFDHGTQIRNPDTDGDGISDGEEVVAGADGFITNPLLADSDGDGVRDALEIATGSDPNNPASINLAAALSGIEVAPQSFVLTVNSVIGEASQQLTVTGRLKDGTSLGLTSTLRGTNYSSSDLNVCNFGSPDGRVFAASNGACTITVTNSGLTAQSLGTVNSFTPTPLSFVAIPGFPNNVDVSGNFAYVAAGAAGLQVVNVSNRAAPVLVASLDTPGNANDVRVVGNLAYVADGTSGLRIIDITNPLAPVSLGAYDTPGDAWDVVVSGNRAYVADGSSGLIIIDVSNPQNPQRLGSVDPAGIQKGVDVDAARNLAVVASGTSGLHVVDISTASNPTVIGSLPGGDVRDVALKGNFAFLADNERSFTSVDLSIPNVPVLSNSTPTSTGGRLQDVAISGNFALGADVFFVNGVPIIDISTESAPNPRAILNFSNFRDDDGQGLAVDGSFVYLTAALGSAFQENGASGNGRLYIGQYLAQEDRAGVAPTVRITAPADGSVVIEGAKIPVAVEAVDDVTVVSVSLLVNGQVAFTDTSAPYQFSVTAPQGVSTITLGATAIDLGGNVGTATNVVVNIMPDPLTTARGRVVDATNTPVTGATVTILSSSATTAGDGTFVIDALRTTQGALFASAVVVVNGVTLRGRSGAVDPVPGGFTELGTITVRQGGKLYGTSSQQGVNPGSIFTIDVETGVPTLVGTPANTPNGLSDVSFNPVTGALNAMHGASARGAELLTLDPATAQVLARVRVTSPRFIQGSDAIAHNAAGLLYVGAWAPGRLLTVDPITGVAATDIDVTAGGGNNHLADLAIDPTTGEMWAARGGSFAGRIVRLDPATAVVNRIFDLPILSNSEITGIAFDSNGQMYVAIGGDQLAKVDKNTGAFTRIGTGFNGVKISGLGFQP